MNDRDTWLTLDDAELLKQCAVDCYRASGPGGQKRNKTSSAVRLRHRPSGLMVIAEESRSQHENKARAVKRLRFALALQIRRPRRPDAALRELLSGQRSADGHFRVSIRNPDFPTIAAAILDAVADCGGRMKDAAEGLGLTTGQLSRFLASYDKLHAAANDLRKQNGLKPLTVGPGGH